MLLIPVANKVITITDYFYLKETVPQDFRLQVFHVTVSPKPLIIPLGMFRIFFKNAFPIKLDGDLKNASNLLKGMSGKKV